MPTVVDLNGDFRDDIVFGGETTSVNYIYYYENLGPNQITGAIDFANYEKLKDSLGSYIKTRGRTRVAFIDMPPNDGLKDMIVGEMFHSGTWQSDLHLYRNTGTAIQPVWTHDPTWALPLNSDYIKTREMYWIAIGDINGDGLDDMMVCYFVGYESSGAIYPTGSEVHINSPWGISSFLQTATSFVGDTSNSLPLQYSEGYGQLAFGDFDNDGDVDLISVNKRLGKLLYYERTGATSWALKAEDWSLSGEAYGNHVHPAVIDYNGDGVLDLMLGVSNKIWFYEGGACAFAGCTQAGGSCDLLMAEDMSPSCGCAGDGFTEVRILLLFVVVGPIDPPILLTHYFFVCSFHCLHSFKLYREVPATRARQETTSKKPTNRHT